MPTTQRTARLLAGPAMPAGLTPQRATGPLDELLSSLTPSVGLVVGDRHDEIVLGIIVARGMGRATGVGAVLLLGSAPDDRLVNLWRTECADIPLVLVPDVAGTEPGGMVAPNEPSAAGPEGFTASLVSKAQHAGAHVVLPEGDEPRVLAAAACVLALGAARLTLLGDEGSIRAEARRQAVDISSATIINPASDPLRERFAAEYAELRKAKGVTLEQARERLLDVSYFGTMMVADGLADGMVSGAVNTTAHTIRPAFEVIKTAPGTSIVSSVFLMCLDDRVLVYGDCAVNPSPTPQQLADIAISSAATARAFGIEPRVAMLSYSTLGSGTGPDVDAVVEATRIAREQAPELAIDGPLQYDAAVAPEVASTKAPDSPVAGTASVLVFPSLSAGNIAYKAVQRSAKALAIGPVLQGLRKPVNDLSRGALVDDIVNTIMVTAIQAGDQRS